jgi:hypothetical protein
MAKNYIFYYLNWNKMKLSTIAYLGFSTLLLGLMPTPAMGVTIDLFDDVESTDDPPEQFVSDRFGSSTIFDEITDTSLTNVLGGTRTIKVNKYFPTTNSGSSTAQFVIRESDGRAAFSSTSGTQGTFEITWDGDFGASGIDLTDNDTKDSFLIGVVSNDLGVTLNFDVFDGTNTATYSQAVAAGTLGNVYFPFASFSNQTALQQAKSIKLYSSNEPADLDFTFTLFESAQEVPFEFSPSLGIIMCGSFFGFRAIRKRLKTT